MTTASMVSSQVDPLRARVRRHVHERRRVLFSCLVILCLLLLWRGAQAGAGENPDAALRAWLAHHGYALAGDDVVWLDHDSGPLSLRPALWIGHRWGELDDVYYAQVRASARAVHDVLWLTNLTRSSSAAEGQLTRIGDHVAFALRVGNTIPAVVVLDVRGEPAELTADWPFVARVQNAITNLQETSRVRGLGRAHYRLLEPAAHLALHAEDGRFVVDADGRRIVLVPGRLKPTTGAELVEPLAQNKGQPGAITWLVDTVRNVSFIGPGPIEWLEHTVFGMTDWVSRRYHDIAGRSPDDEMQQALAAPAVSPAPPPARPEPPPEPDALLTAAAPALEWPPPALKPLLPDRQRGEGEWLPVVDSAFVNAYPNAPPALYQTFIRVDPERPYVSVYVTAWDPRQIQLHVVMGTAEPESATGETGNGLIPRDPELLQRLVAGFNGGFQAMHGEFGMMADGRVYLPPKPYAATVAVFEDGRVGMGSWPGPGRDGWDEESANAQIPPDMVAMRQNLTSVVEDGSYNPWERWWWGAAPEWAEEQTYIVRSGLCVTRAGNMAYFWGDSMGPEELGRAMLAVDCVRGMHLDMNSKHTGFELYRPFPPESSPPPLGRALGAQEYEGPLELGRGFTFRARLAVKLMTPLRFPRYLERDPRDFFFLSLKPVLPGPDARIDGQARAFTSEGLPNAGWPQALARASLGAAGADAGPAAGWLVRIDPARAVPAPAAPAMLERPLARLIGVATSEEEAGADGELALYAEPGGGAPLRYRVGTPPRGAVVVLRAPGLGAQLPTTRALGVDADGFVVYAEVSAADAVQLPDWLRQAGVDRALALPESAALGFQVDDKLVAVDGSHELPDVGPGLAWLAETRPAASVMYRDVAPRPYRRWAGPQGQRVRYFPTNPPRFRAPSEALLPSAAAPDSAVRPPSP